MCNLRGREKETEATGRESIPKSRDKDTGPNDHAERGEKEREREKAQRLALMHAVSSAWANLTI